MVTTTWQESPGHATTSSSLTSAEMTCRVLRWRFGSDLNRFRIMAVLGLRCVMLLSGLAVAAGSGASLLLAVSLASGLAALAPLASGRLPLLITPLLGALSLLLLLVCSDVHLVLLLVPLLIIEAELALVGRGALIGGAASVVLGIMLQLLYLEYAHGLGVLVLLSFGYLIWGAGVTWAGRRLGAIVALIRERLEQSAHVATTCQHLRRAIEWQQLSLQVLRCSTIEELHKVASTYATIIAGVPATLELAGAADDPAAPAARCRFRLGPGIEGGTHAALDHDQRSALDELGLIAGLRWSTLRMAEAQRLYQDGMIALGEVLGLLRSMPSLEATDLHNLLRHLHRALALDWLALFVPDPLSARPAVMLSAAGHAHAPPRLSPSEWRVVGEALRVGCPLVHNGGTGALVCLPFSRGALPQLVVAARGAAGDQVVQSILLLFGELVIDRLAREEARL